MDANMRERPAKNIASIADSGARFANMFDAPLRDVDLVTVVHDNPTCLRCCGKDVSTCASFTKTETKRLEEVPPKRRRCKCCQSVTTCCCLRPCCCCHKDASADAPIGAESDSSVRKNVTHESYLSTGACGCMRICAADEWSNDRILSPATYWWQDRTITFVSDMHLSCGFGIDDWSEYAGRKVDPNNTRACIARDVMLLDQLISRTLLSLGDRTVYLGDIYDMWCAVGGTLPMSDARRAVGRTLGWGRPFWAPMVWGVDPDKKYVDDPDSGRGGTRAKFVEELEVAVQSNEHLRTASGHLSAAAVWLSSYTADAIDRGNAFAGATVRCCTLEPWDALFPAIVETWHLTHAVITDSVLGRRAIIISGNHDAAAAMCLQRIRHQYNPPSAVHMDTQSLQCERIPCYNSVEFGDVLRAEHGHRWDVTCDDRSVLSYGVSCMGCVAGHWKAQAMATGMNGCVRRGHQAFTKSIFGRMCNFMCCPLSSNPRREQHVNTHSKSYIPLHDGVDADAAMAVSADGALSYNPPPKPLGAVVFGHTHRQAIRLVPKTGALYVNTGNSARPIRRVVGASLGKLDRSLTSLVEQYARMLSPDEFSAAVRIGDLPTMSTPAPLAVEPLTPDEFSSLTIDVARVKFDKNGNLESAETGVVNIVTRAFTQTMSAKFNT